MGQVRLEKINKVPPVSSSHLWLPSACRGCLSCCHSTREITDACRAAPPQTNVGMTNSHRLHRLFAHKRHAAPHENDACESSTTIEEPGARRGDVSSDRRRLRGSQRPLGHHKWGRRLWRRGRKTRQTCLIGVYLGGNLSCPAINRFNPKLTSRVKEVLTGRQSRVWWKRHPLSHAGSVCPHSIRT